MRRARGPAAVLVAVLLAVVLPAAVLPATARAVEPRVIARGLERSPLYVDPAYEGAVRPAERKRIVRRLRALGEPVFVALAPLVEGDQFGGDPRRFLDAVRGRLGRPGLYVTNGGGYLVSDSDDEQLQQRGFAATYLASFGQHRYRAPVADQLEAFTRALDDPRLQQRYEAAQRDRASSTPSPPARPRARGSDAGSTALGAIALAVLAVLVVALAVVLVRRRRGATALGAPPPVLPERVFEHARQAELEELHERAEQEVIASAALLDDRPAPRSGPAEAAYARALDDQSAASGLLEKARTKTELAAVLVLVDGVRRELGGTGGPLCFFDPLHGRAQGSVAFGPRRVDACGDCRAAVARGDQPAVLRDDGRAWFEGDGAIARSGFGQFDALAPRLLRGERP